MRFRIITIILSAVFAVSIQAQTTAVDSTKKSDLKYRVEAGYGQLYRYGDAIVNHLITQSAPGLTLKSLSALVSGWKPD